MNGREQKTDKDTYLQKDRAALESYAEGQTFLWMTEKGDTNTATGGAKLFEFILSPANLNSAYKQVKRNNGSGGIDGMDTEALRLYLQTHREALLTSFQEGNYKPQPVRRAEIPKDNGRKRQLGIPTVVDRVIQQAITQQLSPIYESLALPTTCWFDSIAAM